MRTLSEMLAAKCTELKDHLDSDDSRRVDPPAFNIDPGYRSRIIEIDFAGTTF